MQEAKSASSLNHPHIVTVHEIDTVEGMTFIAMEYIEGRTLDQVIPQRGLRYTEVLKYAVQIAEGLAAAHAIGIIHRDVKPANVMVSGAGVVKVLDFGLAKHAGYPAPSPSGETVTMAGESPLTRDGAIVGTVAYMSPEQAEGKPLDARSDIFSFGIVLYEMLTGRRPFAGDSQVSTMAALMNKEPKPVRQIVEGLPPEVDRLVSRCLRKDPARRIQTMADLAVALRDLKEESDSGTLAPAVAGETCPEVGLGPRSCGGPGRCGRCLDGHPQISPIRPRPSRRSPTMPVPNSSPPSRPMGNRSPSVGTARRAATSTSTSS